MSDTRCERGPKSPPMPEGVIWPTFDDGQPVRFGDEIEGVDGKVRYFHIFQHVVHIGTDEWEWWDSNTDAPPKRRKPEVLDADGMPIKVGDTVWYEDKAWRVTDVYACSDGEGGVNLDSLIEVEYDEPAEAVANAWSKLITHRKPDTQEAIDADCMMDAKDYCEKHGIKAEFPKHCGKAKCEHLLARQRRLMGGE